METATRVDVGARVDADVVQLLDELARRHRWSRSTAIAVALERLVRSEPAPFVGWDNAEVRG